MPVVDAPRREHRGGFGERRCDQRDTARRHGLGDPLRYEREIVNLYPDDPSYLRRYLEEQVRLVATELQQQGAPGKSLSAREQALLKELKRLRGRFPALTGDLLKVEAGLYEGHRDIDAAIAVYRRDLDGDPTPANLVPGEDRGDRYGDLVTLLRRHGRDREIIRGLAARAQAGRLSGVDLALLCAFYQGDGTKLRALLTQVNTVPVGTAVPASELLLRGRLLRRYLSAAEALPVLYGGYRAALAEGAKPAVQVALLGELGRALVSDAQVATALTPLSPLTAFTLRRVSSGPSILGGLASLLFNGHVAGDNHDEARDLDGVARAMANAARALKLGGDKAPYALEAYLMLGDIHRERRQRLEATRYYRKWLELAPLKAAERSDIEAYVERSSR